MALTAIDCDDRVEQLEAVNQLLQKQVENFKRRILYGICYEIERHTILVTCGHTFCHQFLESAEEH